MRKLDWRWWGMMGSVAVLFWAVGAKRLDPDFGWHVGMGRYIVEHGGVPTGDPFSYTMPDFDFVDHEWLTNVLMYRGLEKLGYGGVAVGFAAVTAAALAISLSGPERKWGWIPAGLVVAMWLGRGGVRPQVIDWLLLAILLRWFGERKWWRRLRGWWPVMMAAWVNLHGGFAIGIVVLGVAVGVRAVEERKVEIKDVGAWLLGVAATGVNPYGWRVWYEVWMQISDSHLRWSIQEWLPFFVIVEFGFLYLLVLAGTLGVKYWGKMEKWRLGVAAGTAVAGVASLRHVALFAVAGGRVAAQGLGMLEAQARERGVPEWRWRKVYLLFGALAGMIVGWEVMWTGVGLLRGGGISYPVAAVEYLRENLPEGRLFSEYGWGGYLIWKLPEKRVFIDGRMPSWRSADLVPGGKWLVGEKEGVRGEWAFKEYQQATDKGEWEEVFEKYGVEVVLWPVGGRESKYLEAINRWLRRVGLKVWEEEKKGLGQRLVEAGWEVKYKDEVAVVYARSE